ncbi:hypothetical protein [Paraburkholderia flava]|uniref:hypothetical protein n=1 Tax=Paraburkholderia flava TaxID=2547393 RepID=UPI00105EAB47|nr:hypothetical protein [Paraburkholderia flava]
MNARALALTVLFFGAATAAHAQTYVEIWNPPEARAHPPVRHGASGTRPKSVAQAPRLAKRVTGHAGASESTAPIVTQPKKSDALPVLPRKIGPDGRVLQV